jgi:YHS domain-containing protein
MAGKLRIDEAINTTCPWSGNPIDADSLTLYRGEVVGFCNPGCRDKFEKAVQHFEAVLAKGN